QQLLNGAAGLQTTAAPSGYSIGGTATSGSGTYNVTAFSAATKTHLAAASGPAALAHGEIGTVTINGVAITLDATGGALNQSQIISAINGTGGSNEVLTGVTAVQNASGNLELVSNA